MIPAHDAPSRGGLLENVLLLEDLPETRAWLKALVLQVLPNCQIFEAARVHDALELVGRSGSTWH